MAFEFMPMAGLSLLLLRPLSGYPDPIFIMRFVVRFAWFISLLGFLFVLFSTYGHVQQVLLLQFGETTFALSRGQYFFFFLAFFLIVNVLLFILGKLMSFIPKSFLFIPNRQFWTLDREHRKATNLILESWTWAISSTANFFMMYWMIVVENNFHFEGSKLPMVHWFYIPGLFMVASLFLPWLRFLIPNLNLLARQERD